jgi:hypothetical protein
MLSKRRKGKIQVNEIRGDKGDIPTDTNEIQKIIREYFENLHSSKLENQEEINFLTHMTH